MLIITGGVLFASDKIRNTTKTEMSAPSSLLVGLAQSIAIIPGISRSGATITTGIFTGRTRDLATRFSFLLSIPAILGATLLKLKDLQSAVSSGSMGLNFILGGIFCGNSWILCDCHSHQNDQESKVVLLRYLLLDNRNYHHIFNLNYDK